MTNIRLATTGSYIIVICKIDIEDQFLIKRLECGCFSEHLSVTGVGAVDGSDLEPSWVESADIFPKSTSTKHMLTFMGQRHYNLQLRCWIALVTDIGSVLENESELSMRKVARGFY